MLRNVSSSDPRLSATRHLVQVCEQHLTLDQVLDADTQPLVRELVSGTLRHYYSLTARVDQHLRKPLRQKDADIRLLLLVGVYQLLHTRIPSHAAVSETVACTAKLKKTWARGLVNAVLRAVSRTTDANPCAADVVPAQPSATFDHPDWFIEHCQRALPEHWHSVLHANNTRAPMSIRINPRKVSPARYQDKLREQGIEAEPNHPDHPETLTLTTPIPQDTLPGYVCLLYTSDAADE